MTSACITLNVSLSPVCICLDLYSKLQKSKTNTSMGSWRKTEKDAIWRDTEPIDTSRDDVRSWHWTELGGKNGLPDDVTGKTKV